jgi:hypothetical protein
MRTRARQLLITALLLSAVGAVTPVLAQARMLPSSKASDVQSMDRRTRAYLNAMAVCEAAVDLTMGEIRRGKSSDFQLADDITQARDICNGIRSKLLRLNTDHFDNEASAGWYAIDRLKSGLNALLAYLDNPRPSKLVEARNKIQDGQHTAAQAHSGINRRRRVFGLKSYNP